MTLKNAKDIKINRSVTWTKKVVQPVTKHFNSDGPQPFWTGGIVETFLHKDEQRESW